MRAPKRKRPLRRTIIAASESNLEKLALRTRYVGSVEHKDGISFAGAPQPRADASICDRDLADRQDHLTEWLHEAVRRGAIGAPWEEEFPRYAWYLDGTTLYEARLVNRSQGTYKGYPLSRDEWPDHIEEYYGA